MDNYFSVCIHYRHVKFNHLLFSLINISVFSFSAVSYNQPNLSACTEWNSTDTGSLIDSSIKLNAQTLFIDKQNTIYITHRYTNYLFQLSLDNSSLTGRIVNGIERIDGLFVLTENDIYVNQVFEVYRLIAANNTVEPVAKYCRGCYHIFIAINNVIYCSIGFSHIVITKSLHNDSNIVTIVAGVGVRGSNENMLNNPHGIFVNTNLDLYVADRENDRIQLFHPGEINGKTVVARNDTSFCQLIKPIGIILDGNDQLYIVLAYNYGIFRQTRYGCRCIASCSSTSSNLIHQSLDIKNIAFDRFGNIYVTSLDNPYIRKVSLSNNICNNTISKFRNVRDSFISILLLYSRFYE